MSFRLEIESDDCMSSGKCVADYPNAFEFDDDELAKLTSEGALSNDEIIRVARNCPSRAILVFDENGDSVQT